MKHINPKDISKNTGIPLSTIVTIMFELEKHGIVNSVLKTTCPACGGTILVSQSISEIPDVAICNFCNWQGHTIENTYVYYENKNVLIQDLEDIL